MIKQQPGGQAVVFWRFFTQLCHSASEAVKYPLQLLISDTMRSRCHVPAAAAVDLSHVGTPWPPAPPLCVLQTVPEVNPDRDQRRQCASSPFVFHSGTCAFCYTCALQQVQTFSLCAHVTVSPDSLQAEQRTQWLFLPPPDNSRSQCKVMGSPLCAPASCITVISRCFLQSWKSGVMINVPWLMHAPSSARDHLKKEGYRVRQRFTLWNVNLT